MIQEADLNTAQEFSASAVNSELQSYFDYVVQNENIVYPPNNWIEGKNMFLTSACAANIPCWFPKTTELLYFLLEFYPELDFY